MRVMGARCMWVGAGDPCALPASQPTPLSCNLALRVRPG